ncbi:hypothetical protein [Streptomyces sp. NPDC016172]|uniref:hypothetical protein n=1 Tax=Streptomyces sp. NPDC016172 TaxID=3364964 RepID=UPI003702DB72
MARIAWTDQEAVALRRSVGQAAATCLYRLILPGEIPTLLANLANCIVKLQVTGLVWVMCGMLVPVAWG